MPDSTGEGPVPTPDNQPEQWECSHLPRCSDAACSDNPAMQRWIKGERAPSTPPAVGPGCCTSCEGTGTSTDTSTGGLCWDCRGTGHPHDGPCTPPAGNLVLVEGSWFKPEDLPAVLGNFMRTADEYGREAKDLAQRLATAEQGKERLTELGWQYARQRDALQRQVDEQTAVHRQTSEDLQTWRRRAQALQRWKDEALPVLDGLQDLGRALGMGPGQRITGPEAAERAEALQREVDAAARADQPILRTVAEKKTFEQEWDARVQAGWEKCTGHVMVKQTGGFQVCTKCGMTR